jgi:hypothetical protein
VNRWHLTKKAETIVSAFFVEIDKLSLALRSTRNAASIAITPSAAAFIAISAWPAHTAITEGSWRSHTAIIALESGAHAGLIETGHAAARKTARHSAI